MTNQWPEDYHIYTLIGVIACIAGEYTFALKLFRKSLSLNKNINPKDRSVYITLIKIKKIWPNDLHILNELAVILCEAGYHDYALKTFRRAYLINKQDKNILSNISKVLLHLYINSTASFEGWGMKTNHALPWEDKQTSAFLLKANEDIKVDFDFSGDGGTTSDNIDDVLWRHWTISYSIRHAVEFTGSNNNKFIAVECGVQDGISAFFSLNELKGQCGLGRIESFCMHLYDSWQPMRAEYLLQSEKESVGSYKINSIERTKRNLLAFNENIVYHQGYIPESLHTGPPAPQSINYLHIDLNSAEPTLKALELFFPKLLSGGVIVFDDYGWSSYKDTRHVVINFFSDKPGMLMPLPTGQALYYR